MKAKRIISLFLLASLLTSASACGSEAPEKESTDTTAGETTGKPEYEFPELNCGGDEFTILNTGWVWSMYNGPPKSLHQFTINRERGIIKQKEQKNHDTKDIHSGIQDEACPRGGP